MKLSLTLKTLTFMLSLLSFQSFAAEVCWKKSYGRGVGVIPSQCDWVAQDKSGLLCYPKAGANSTTVAGVNWAICPPGYTDNGAYCRDAYSRGTLWFSQNNCNNANKDVGGCEWSWGAWYPKCKPGYTAETASFCSRCPQGWTRAAGTDSCYKPTKVFAPITPRCAIDQEYNAGLCYKKCDAGNYGVGPVCWGECPEDKPFDCGAICATSALTCGLSIADMIMSVGTVAAEAATFIATFGASAAASGAKAAAKASAAVALKSLAKKTAKNMAAKFISLSKEDKKGAAVKALMDEFPGLPEKDAKALAEMQADPDKFDYDDFFTEVDPTGIAKAVKAFRHDVCDVYVTKRTRAKLELSAIPNVCEKMKGDASYKSMLDRKPGAAGFDKNKLVQFLRRFVRAPGFDNWDPKFLHLVLTLNCTGMRKNPSYVEMANKEGPTWTDNERNGVISMIFNALKVEQADRDNLVRALQGLQNAELLEFLRGI